MDHIVNLVKRAKLQFVNLGLILLAVLLMFGSFVEDSIDAFGINESFSANFFQVSEFFSAIVLIIYIVTIATLEYIILRSKNVKFSSTDLVRAAVVYILVGLGVIILSTLAVIINMDNAGFGFGYLLFVLINMALISVNVYKVLINKDDALNLFDATTKKVKETVDKAQEEWNKPNKPESEDVEPDENSDESSSKDKKDK